MADEDRDPSQKTEEPTSRRLQQARENGDQIKSVEVQTFIILSGALLAITAFGPSVAIKSFNTFRMFIAEPDRMATDPQALILLMRNVLMRMGEILAPIFVLLIVSGVGSNLIQNMPTFTPSRIVPNFSKLSLFSGLKRIFGMDGITNLLKGMLKMAVVAVAIATQIWPQRSGLEAVLTQSPAAVAADISRLFYRMMLAALAAIAVIAAADYMWQRHEFFKRNRMSREEVKEEFKDTEGDPKIKGKIRQIRVERSRKRMMAAVPKATVVITNPTHYAVALLYEAGKTAAPICVAKGVDELAFRIRDLAKKSDVPVVESPPLARALYASVEVDDAIPPEHYKAVAQIIGYVLRQSGKMQ